MSWPTTVAHKNNELHHVQNSQKMNLAIGSRSRRKAVVLVQVLESTFRKPKLVPRTQPYSGYEPQWLNSSVLRICRWRNSFFCQLVSYLWVSTQSSPYAKISISTFVIWGYLMFWCFTVSCLGWQEGDVAGNCWQKGAEILAPRDCTCETANIDGTLRIY